MAHIRFLAFALGSLLLIVGWGTHAPEAGAQDRSVPRFGPLVSSDTSAAAPEELGRIWSFAEPPIGELQRAYGPVISEEALESLRTGVVRLPECSGTLVSARGLVLTAARCLRGGGDAPAEGPDTAYVAEQAGGDRALSGVYVDRLLAVDDVTAQVESAMAGASDGDSVRWRTAVDRVEAAQQPAGASDQRVEVVREAGGRRYVAYTYRRHQDVRLVFRPHRAVTAYGQAEAMLSYPQHAWDVAALRIYEDGAPLDTPGYVEVHEQGTRPGDAVVAAGHPPTIPRAESAAQHAVRRDITLPAQRAALTAATTHLRTYLDTASTAPGRWHDRLAMRTEQLKRVRARLDALRSDPVWAQLQAHDERVRAGGAGAILDTLAALQAEKRAYADRYRAAAFLFRPLPQSATLARALIVHRARQAGRPPSADALAAVPAQPQAVDAALLRRQRQRLRATAGDRIDTTVPPTIVEASVFASADSVRTRLTNGTLPADDPALRLAAAVSEEYRPAVTAWARIEERERGPTEQLARVRYESDDRPVALPRARAPRFTDGRITGYPYNGTTAPPTTTMYGLYGAVAPSARPAPWASLPSAFDRATPLATVSSTDLPNSHGGPLLNSDLQLVGIQFDTNVQGAASPYLFVPDRMRTVSVDIRGVLEGLTHVYGAERLVRELTSPPAASK